MNQSNAAYKKFSNMNYFSVTFPKNHKKANKKLTIVDAKLQISLMRVVTFTKIEREKGHIAIEDKRNGKLINFKLTHPNYIIFADENGCNMSIRSDGNISSIKFLTKR